MEEASSENRSAAQRVFGTVELLLKILVDLEYDELYVIQRVNSTFRDVIADSKPLRQIMYLELLNLSHDDSRTLQTREDLHPLSQFKIQKAIWPWDVMSRAQDQSQNVQTQDGQTQDMAEPQEQRLEYIYFDIFPAMGSADDCFKHDSPLEDSSPSWRKIRIGGEGFGFCVVIPARMTGRYYTMRPEMKISEDMTLGELVSMAQSAIRHGVKATTARVL